ncbi:hypothetical protein ACLOJK_011201 [Asimina triloba]
MEMTIPILILWRGVMLPLARSSITIQKVRLSMEMTTRVTGEELEKEPSVKECLPETKFGEEEGGRPKIETTGSRRKAGRWVGSVSSAEETTVTGSCRQAGRWVVPVGSDKILPIGRKMSWSHRQRKEDGNDRILVAGREMSCSHRQRRGDDSDRISPAGKEMGKSRRQHRGDRRQCRGDNSVRSTVTEKVGGSAGVGNRMAEEASTVGGQKRWEQAIKASVPRGFRSCVLSLGRNVNGQRKGCQRLKIASGALASIDSLLRPFHKLKSFTSRTWSLLLCIRATKFKEGVTGIHKITNWQGEFRSRFSLLFFRLAVGVVLFVSLSMAVSKTPSWALTEENRLFLEAWRTIDRAYYDKTFNGQNWFRYRENALRTEPMNTREETCNAFVLCSFLLFLGCSSV